MNRKSCLTAIVAAMLLLSGCYTTYVSEMESVYFTKNCPAKNILIISSQDGLASNMNESLVSELDKLLQAKGYTVREYCPSTFDSAEYRNIISSLNPEFLICIQYAPADLRKTSGMKKRPYKVEALYKRDKGEMASVFLGRISITYNESKKSEILKDASGKIYAAIVDNEILK